MAATLSDLYNQYRLKTVANQAHFAGASTAPQIGAVINTQVNAPVSTSRVRCTGRPATSAFSIDPPSAARRAAHAPAAGRRASRAAAGRPPRQTSGTGQGRAAVESLSMLRAARCHGQPAAALPPAAAPPARRGANRVQ